MSITAGILVIKAHLRSLKTLWYTALVLACMIIYSKKYEI